MKKVKTVKIGNLICIVETLREWLNSRITVIRETRRENPDNPIIEANLAGRLAELLIIRDKINDGRIEGIR